MTLRSIFVLLFVVFSGFAPARAATGLTFHGRILNSNSTPLQSANVNFILELRSPGVENCLLYQEMQNLDMSGSNGIFVLTLGSGARSAPGVDGGNSMERIFANRGTLVLPTCASVGSYTPSSTDGRKLSVRFSDNGGAWQTLPVQNINYSPLAIEAIQVGGYGTGQLLRVANGTTATELSNANWNELWALITGASTVYQLANGSNFSPTAAVDFNGQRIIDLADPTLAQDAATKNYSDTKIGGKNIDVSTVTSMAGNGHVLVWDQAQNRWETGVPNDTTKLALTGDTMLGPINMGAFSITNAGHVAISDQGTLYLGKFTNAQEATLVGTPLNNTTDRGRSWFNVDTGKMRFWNGTTAQNVGAISSSDVTTALTYTPVNRAGDTMTGLLVLSADPSAVLGAATKQYVDAVTTASAGAYVRIDGTTALTGNWDVNGATVGGTSLLTGLGTPTVADGAATKGYADANLLGNAITAPAAGNVNQSIRWNATGTAWEYFTAGNAVTTGKLSQFAVTSSAELAGVISDESGTGLLIYGTSPTLVTPTIRAFTLGGATSDGITMQVAATGATGTYTWPSALPGGNRLLQSDAAGNLSWINAGGGGDAFVANPLSQFASTTSAQLATVLNDETGSGLAVFATSPTITTPVIGTGFTVNGSTNGNVTFNAPATGAAGTYVLPSALPLSNMVLQSDSSGNLTWVPDSTGSGDLKADGSVALTGNWDVNGATVGGTSLLTGLGTPTVADGAATKGYADASLLGNALAAPAAGNVNQSIRWNAAGTAWEYYTPSTSIAADSLNFTDFSDALTLDASTDIAADGAEVLSITNTGTGNSLVVNDEAADASPFVIDATGNVGIGTAAPSDKLTIFGSAATAGSMMVANSDWNGFGAGTGITIGTGAASGITYTKLQALTLGGFATGDISLNPGGGNVGIGTASPNQLLTVEGPMSLRTQAAPTLTANYGKIYVDSADSDKLKYMNPAGAIVDLSAAGSGAIADDTLDFAKFIDSMTLDAITTITAPSGQAYALSINNEGTGASFRVNDAAADTTPFVVDASGNVGIGTAAPTTSLHVIRSDNTAAAVLENNRDLDGVERVLNILRTRSSSTAPAAGFGSKISFQAESATDNSIFEQGSVSAIWEDAPIVPGGMDGALTFATAIDGNVQEKMRITSEGRIGIGTVDPNQLLTVAGPMSLAAAAAPSLTAGFGKIYVDSGDSNKLKYMNPAGAIVDLSAAGTTTIADDSLNFDKLSDTLSLDASTDIAVSGTNMLSITNTGTGSSLRINDGDATPFVVDDWGWVGVGTATPQARLHVAGNNLAETSARFGEFSIHSFLESQGMISHGSTFNGVNYIYNSTSPSLLMQWGSPANGDMTIKTAPAGTAAAVATMTDRFTIKNTGNVGIGTNAPNQLLTVEGPMSLRTQAAPTLTANYGKIYVDSGDSNKLKYMNPAGAIVDLSSAGSASLANFTESANSAAPNATVPVVSFAPNNAATNVDIALVPKGTGSLMIDIPNNAASGGNKRGTAAIDLQFTRSTANQVASGNNSFAAGTSNVVSGAGAFAFGSNSTASGAGSVVLGGSNIASNSNSYAFGINNSSSGFGAFAMGNGSSASGAFAFALGESASASGTNSFAANVFTTAAAFAQTTFGQYNLPTGTETAGSWVATDPLFVIGNGTGSGASRSNALMMLKDGKTSIGSSVPNEMLTVEGVTSLKAVAVPTATANYGKIYVDSGDSNKLKYMDPAGAIVDLSAGGGVADDSLNFDKFIDAMTLDATSTITAPSGQAYALNIVNEGTGNSFFVGDQAADASPFVIDASGNVGIGIAAPNSQLEVVSSGGGDGIRASTTGGNAVEGTASNGTGIKGTATAFGIGVEASTVGGTGVTAVATDAGGTGGEFQNSGGGLALWVSQGESVFAGNVGIGAASAGEKLEVSGNVKATSFISTSDARLKNNVETVSGLDAVLGMRGVSWNWNSDGTKDSGVIAQELEKVLPTAVVTGNDGMKSVKYNSLIAEIIEATKELYKMVTGTEEKVADQAREIASLKKSLVEIENENREMKERLSKIEAQLAK